MADVPVSTYCEYFDSGHRAMLLLWVLCALACACACTLPECSEPRACAAAGPRDTPDDWITNYYVVNGQRLAVVESGAALRWRCARRLDPRAPAAPRFTTSRFSSSVEFIDCTVSGASYSALLDDLSIITKNLTIAFTMPRDERWPSTDKLKLPKENHGIAIAPLQQLILRRTPMTVEQFASIRHIKSLSLENTGLEEVMDLSAFKELSRLELLEPGLVDAQRLASAPALTELVLRAPDAALAALPKLRDATFLDVYSMYSIFGDCSNLHKLAVEGGELAEVHARWLAGCVRLQWLRLTRLRRLRALPRRLLVDATALVSLDLSRNALEVLPDDLLASAARLAWLDLSHNALHALSADLSPRSSLVLVSLRGNPRDFANASDLLKPMKFEVKDSCFYLPTNSNAKKHCGADEEGNIV